jgi:hypothetical protein
MDFYNPLSGLVIVPSALSDLERKQITTIFCQMDSTTADITAGDGTAEQTIETKVVCDTQKTTCFVEAETIVTSRFKSEKMFSHIDDTLEDIRDFLGKPYLINQVQWSAAQATNTSILSIPATPTDGIGSFLTTVTQWEIKRRGFELVRGTFVLRLEINSNPFQAGSAIIHYLPNYKQRTAIEPTFPKRYNKHLIQKFQHPYARFEVKDTCVIFKVPYIAPTPWFDIKASDWDWGSIFVDVVAPFKTGASGNSYAEVSAFIYWEDIQLAAPIVPQMDNSSSNRRRKDLESKELNSNKPITNTLKTVSKVAGSLTSVPLLAPIAAPVEWASDMASQVASIFGWAKPRVNETPNVVALQPFRYHGNADGPDLALQTAIISNNKLETTTSYTLTDEDEMSLKYLLKVPTYMGIVNWPVATASSDTPLYSKAISPRGMVLVTSDVVGLYTAGYTVGAPLYYLNNFFSYYRGSIQLTIKVVKTIYHSGKLLITWTPYNSSSLAVAVTRATSVYSLRHIIDIREQSEITLNLPYLVNRPYLNCIYDYTGTVNVFILNELRVPETANQSVDLEIYYTAGDDFEFQVPCSISAVSNYGIYTPQMDNSSEIVNMGIADTKVDSTSTDFSTMSIGEHVVSLKQFLNRGSTSFPGVSQTYSTGSLAIYPWHITGSTLTAGTGVLTAGALTPDALSWFAPLYAYIRGGIRIALFSGNGKVIYSLNVPDIFRIITPPTDPFTTALASLNGTNSTAGAPAPPVTSSYTAQPLNTAIPNSVLGQAYSHIPYQAKFPVTIPYVWQTTGSATIFTANTNDWLPTSTAVFTSPANFGSETVWQRSCADDFQCSFFIGCPPLLYSWALT